MRQLPPVVVDFINRKYGRQKVVVATAPYWSTIRLSAPFATGIIPAGGSRQAFSYGVGTDMALAGRVGLANLSDTNLQKPGETRKNADIFVAGVAAYFTQDAQTGGSDPAFFGGVMRECSVEITTVAGRTDPLATLEMLPSGGGLTGSSSSRSLEPNQLTPGIADGGAGADIAFAGNGNPMAGNFFMLDAPVLWTGQTGVDSNFRLIVNNARAITRAPGVVRAAVAGGATTSGTAAFTAPTVDPFVDIRFRLAVFEISLPSVNQ